MNRHFFRGPGASGPVILAALLAAGCATPPVSDPASRYYDIPAGSTFTLRRALEIPSGRARVALQEARAAASSAARPYDVFCEIEVDEVSGIPPQVLHPGRFTITRSWRQQDLSTGGAPLQLAGLGFGIGIGIGGGQLGFGGGRDGGAQQVLYVVRMQLQSAAQPQVRQLRCSTGWAHAPEATFPSLAEIRAALGEVASLDLP